MSTIHAVVLLVAFACLTSAKTQIDGKNLTYECTHDEKIIINGTCSYGSIYAVQNLENKSQQTVCNVTKNTNHSDPCVIFTVQGCNVSLPVVITVMQDQQEPRIDMILGGKGVTQYELKCNQIRLGGWNMTHIFEINETDILKPNLTHQMEVNVSMQIVQKDNTQVNPSVLVTIGTELHLRISGNNGFVFFVQSCIASDGTYTKTLSHNGVTLDDSVISNFSHVNSSNDNQPNVIEASLFAFHFLNTHTIFINCTITVCQDDDNSCPFSIHGNSGRRKRSALVKPHTQTLATSLSVVDSYIDKTENSFEPGVSTGSRSVVVPLVLCVAFGIVRIQI